MASNKAYRLKSEHYAAGVDMRGDVNQKLGCQPLLQPEVCHNLSSTKMICAK